MPVVTHPVLGDRPIVGGFAITAADADLAESPRGIWVETGGTLVLTFLDGTGPFTFTVAGGQWFPVTEVKQVKAASTATGLIGGR